MVIYVIGALALGFAIAAVMADMSYRARVNKQIRIVQAHYELSQTKKPYGAEQNMYVYATQMLRQLRDSI